MNALRLALAAGWVAGLPAAPAIAQDCAAAAVAAAQEHGSAKVLSVRQEGAVCVIVLLVPGQYGQAPRQVIVRKGG
jgi:hypothetical protein